MSNKNSPHHTSHARRSCLRSRPRRARVRSIYKYRLIKTWKRLALYQCSGPRLVVQCCSGQCSVVCNGRHTTDKSRATRNTVSDPTSVELLLLRGRVGRRGLWGARVKSPCGRKVTVAVYRYHTKRFALARQRGGARTCSARLNIQQRHKSNHLSKSAVTHGFPHKRCDALVP